MKVETPEKADLPMKPFFEAYKKFESKELYAFALGAGVHKKRAGHTLTWSFRHFGWSESLGDAQYKSLIYKEKNK